MYGCKFFFFSLDFDPVDVVQLICQFHGGISGTYDAGELVPYGSRELHRRKRVVRDKCEK